MSDTTTTITLNSTILDGEFWPAGGSRIRSAKTGQWDADMNALIANGYNADGVSGTIITEGIPADFATNDDSKRLVRTLRQALAHTANRLTKVDGAATKSLDSRAMVVTAELADRLGVEAGQAVLVWRLVDRRAQPAGLAKPATAEPATDAPAKAKSK